MDLIEQVREIGADEASISDASVNAARVALLRETALGSNPQRRPRSRRTRTWTGIGLGGLVAGTAVTAIVVGSIFAPPAMPNAAAAEALEETATMTVHAQDAMLLPGQYLRIETESEFLQFWRAEWADDGDENTFAFNASRDNADAVVRVRDTRVLYVPADRNADWFYDWGTSEVVGSFGDEGARAEAEWLSDPEMAPREKGSVQPLPAGEFPAPDTDVPSTPYLADSYRPYYETMPREPHDLLDWLRAQSGMTGREADRWLVASLSEPSRINLMPPDLRASFFRALALLPGFEVIAVDGNLTTLRYVVSDHRTTTIVLDTAKGFVQSISESYGADGLAGATPESSTGVRISVVDTAP